LRWRFDALTQAPLICIKAIVGHRSTFSPDRRYHDTYGGFVDLPGFDLYKVKRSGASPAIRQFDYDHRR
jgi:hypothetical protein